MIISNRSDIDNNKFEYFMEGITFTDDNDHPTIKEGQFIRIYLPEDFEEGCTDDSFEWSDSNVGQDLIQGKARVQSVNGKELKIEIFQDFTTGESFNLDNIAVYSPSCRLAGSDGDRLSLIHI